MIFVSRLTDCVHFLQRLFFLSFLFAFLISPGIFRRTARQVQRDFHYAWSGFWIGTGIGVLVDWRIRFSGRDLLHGQCRAPAMSTPELCVSVFELLNGKFSGRNLRLGAGLREDLPPQPTGVM